jgi:hypothetical protein
MAVKKSGGVTESERLLSRLCDRTFLKLWSYPNPYKDDGKELCDLLVVFEDVGFVFFDREKPLEPESDKDPMVLWQRWKRRVIDAQTKTAHGAERYLRSGREIYLDDTLTQKLPVSPKSELRVLHKIVVAHGALEACKQASDSNVYGSLAICYGQLRDEIPHFPFLVVLDKDQPVHVLDTHNLLILLKELDTVWDFSDYLNAKLNAINSLDVLMYCGEEDLLAHYFLTYDEEANRHFIGTKDSSINFLMVGEGEWKDFECSAVYERTKRANHASYLWDDLIQRTSDNALTGRLLGHSPLLHGRSAIHEMAKEPRFSRRALSDHMFRAIESFPDNLGACARTLSLMPSFYPEKRYLFLQLRAPAEIRAAEEFRAKRQFMLEVACGAAKNAFPEIEIVVGIAIDPPKFSSEVSEDFLLMECAQWTEKHRARYIALNEDLGFFRSDLRRSEQKVTRFVPGDPKQED